MEKMNIREVALSVSSMSALMTDRTKKPMEEYLNQTATVSAVDFSNDSSGQPFIIFTTVEYPECFTYGGTVLTDLVTKIINAMGCTKDEFNIQLAQEPLKLRFFRKVSKNNMRYTAVEVV